MRLPPRRMCMTVTYAFTGAPRPLMQFWADARGAHGLQVPVHYSTVGHTISWRSLGAADHHSVVTAECTGVSYRPAPPLKLVIRM
jgi:hypothetical protein